MTVVALCSVKGSPGVTTLAVALAAGWPSGGQPVVVECDPAGGDLMARYRLDLSPGLVTLAAAGRRAGDDAGLIWQHIQRLPGGLPVVAGPPAPAQARAALAELVSGAHGAILQRAASRPGVVVIADCGRVDGESPALAVLRDADLMLLVGGATDDALAHLAVTVGSAAAWSPSPRLVLVGDGYPTDEITLALELEELGIPVAGHLPDDATGAAAFAGRPASRSAPGRSRLGRAAAALAIELDRDVAKTAGHRPVLSAAAEQQPAVGTGATRFPAPSTYGTLP